MHFFARDNCGKWHYMYEVFTDGQVKFYTDHYLKMGKWDRCIFLRCADVNDKLSQLNKLPRFEDGQIRYVEGECRICGDDGACWHCRPYGYFRVSKRTYYIDNPKPSWGLDNWSTQDKDVAEVIANNLGLKLPVWEGEYSVKFYW